MDKSPFGIALMDHERNIIQINRAAEDILGIKRQQAIGLSCTKLFPCYEHNIGCPVLEGRHNIDQHETPCLTRSNTESIVLRSAVISSERGEDLVLEAFIDITATKEAQTAKEEAYRAKDDFFAKMSHELRTPLNAIIGYSELISSDVDDISKQELLDFSGAIQRGGYDLLHLVDQVLDITKLENDSFITNPFNINPEQIINEVTTLISPLAAKNNNQLTILCDEGLGTVYADPEHLRQILLNLLSNACKFTQDGEITLEVKVEALGDASGISFEVHDTGIGLSKEEITRIFEKFEQADNSTTRRFGGTGLGLSIAKELCDLMCGKILVESCPHQGSTFTLWLPSQPQAL